MIKQLFIFINYLFFFYIKKINSLNNYCDHNKIIIKEFQTDDRISDFIWASSTVIFVRTDNNTIYLGKDGGKIWTKQSDKLIDSEKKYNGRHGVKKMLLSPADNKTIYFIGFDGNLWVTEDYGNSYMYNKASFNIEDAQLHPTRNNWLMSDSLTNGCLFNNQGNCYRILHVSQDFGRTWKEIDTYVFQYTWGNAGTDSLPDESIWVLGWNDKTGQQPWKSMFDLELKHSVDWLKTLISHPMQNVIFMLHSRKNFYLAVQKSSLESLKLYVSEDSGKTFVQARFPFRDSLTEDQYTILDDSEGSVFISVRHGSIYWGNVYSSDRLGSDYQLSLLHDRRDRNQNSDFKRIMGLNGIYIANQLQGIVGPNDPGEGAKTLITFDKGGLWQKLSRPYDINGKLMPCNEIDCQLNLHGAKKRSSFQYDNYGPIHSVATAIGLILATGNTGTYLSSDPNRLSTFLSRDAGWTWTEIKKGNNIYEFADHGAIILLSSIYDETQEISYTWNEGLNVTTCQFTNSSPIYVYNIVSEPSSTSQSFILHGTRVIGDATTVGVIVHIDFSGLHERQCTENDYEWWSPFDSRNGTVHCLMGETISFKRRKQNSLCFNGETYEIEKKPQQCPCSREDYECDDCHRLIGQVCSLIPNCSIPQVPCKDFYSVSKGYRLIPGTNCNPYTGLNLLPSLIPCPANNTNKSGGLSVGIIILIILIICGLLIVAIVVIYFNRERIRNLISGFHSTPYIHFESTALDEDLLQTRDAEPLDDNAIEQTINNSTTTTTNQ